MIYKYCLINEQECFIRFKNGLLGNERIPLPSCAYTMIWSIFPVAKRRILLDLLKLPSYAPVNVDPTYPDSGISC
jgi:hypothetical protein